MLGLFKGKGGKKAASTADGGADDLPFASDEGPDEVPAGLEPDPKGKPTRKGLLGGLLGGGAAAPKKKGKGKAAAGPDPFDNPEILALIAAEVSSLPPPSDVPGDESTGRPEDPEIDQARHTRPGVDGPEDAPPPLAAGDGYDDDDDLPPDFDDLDGEGDDKKGRKPLVAGALAAGVALALAGGGAWWMLSGDGAETVAEGSLSEDEPGAPHTPQSGRTITMAMPTASTPTESAVEDSADGRSLARRPWLNDSADGAPAEEAPTETAAAETQEPAEQSAPEEDVAAAAEPEAQPEAESEPETSAADATAEAEAETEAEEPGETPVSLPPEQRLAADAEDDLPPLEEPRFPAEPADQHVVPSFERLPVPKEPPKALAKAPVPAVARNTPQGILPMIGPNGETPWQTYARPFTAPPGTPRIAVVVTGLGLDPEATEAAIVRLAPDVTLSFSPYAPRLADQMARARAHGHEVMLDLPLEGENFPSHDPGPLSMLTVLHQGENLTRLEQVMGRGVGYSGMVGIDGAKFGASRVHMRLVLEQLAQRGLMYVHAGPSTGLAGTGDLAVPSQQSVIDIDARPFREAIDIRLRWLEDVAKVRGTTIAVASPLPVTFERLNRWIGELPRKGVVLAPASAVMPRPAS